MIARVIIKNSEIIIVDEPTANLDVKNQIVVLLIKCVDESRGDSQKRKIPYDFEKMQLMKYLRSYPVGPNTGMSV